MSVQKSNVKDMYSLTPMQGGMLYHSLLDRNSHTYFEQMDILIDGSVDIDLLEKGFNKIIERYDIFRTIFIHERVQKPLQVVMKERRLKVHYKDITSLSDKKKVQFTEEFKRKDRERGFDLSKDILIRVSVLKTESNSCRLIWSHHHIIMDGWCLGIILKELLEIYRALKNERSLCLEATSSYSSYIKWLEERDYEEAAKYWSEYLQGYEEKVSLPTLKNSYENKKYQQAKHNFSIKEDIIDNLEEIARKSNTTLNTIIQVVWGILLQKYNDTDDVVFGAVVSGRPSEVEGIEKMVGLFINTVPVRIKSGSGKLFSELLQDLTENTLEKEKHSYYPLAEIQSGTSLKNNLIDNIMIFENYPIEEVIDSDEQEIGFSIAKIETFEQTNYNFNIMVTLSKGLSIQFSYNELVYDKDLIKKIESHFKSVINTITSDYNISIQNINILSKREKRELLNKFNNTRREYDRTSSLHKLFEDCVFKYSKETAVVWNGKKHSYAELNGAANCVAKELRQRGVTKGSIVCLVVERSFEMMAGLIGILKAGGAYIPVDSEYPAERIDYILEDSKAKKILTNIEKYYIKYKEKAVDLKKSVSGDLTTENPPLLAESEDLAYVIYTSGSTGLPKGVMIENHSVVNFMTGITEQIPFDKNSSILSLTTVSFDIFVLESLLPLTCGSKVVLGNKEEQLSGNKASVVLLEEQISIFQTTPSRLRILMEDEKFCAALEGLTALLIGGELFSVSLLKNVKMIFKGKIYNMYGPTETTIWSTMKDLSGDEALDIGKPIANNQVYIVSKDCRSLQPLGVVGELCIGGESLARGYLNRPELTKERFVKNPFRKGERLYRTGDLAKWKVDGNIEFIGRMDNQVKVRGYRVELGEIETVIRAIDGVEEAIVIYRDMNESQELCAYFTGQEGILIGGLKEGISTKLPHYMIPSYFIQLKELPLNPNGKIDRKALPIPKITHQNYESPNTNLENKLVEIWKAVLQIDKISILDNFFDIGGNSLKLISVVNKLKENVKKDVLITTLFQYPTIQSLARHLAYSDHNSKLSLAKNEFTTQNSECSELNQKNDNEIAIIGIACRFPNADNVKEFWNKLKNGLECITFFKDEDLINFGVSPDLVGSPNYVKAQGVMTNPEYFDSEFFKYSPREAEIMDPQMRIFHEIVWEALEDSGYSSRQHSVPIGLFSSASSNLFWESLVALSGKTKFLGEFASEQLSNKDYMSTRISYKLNLTGPSVSLYTACSSSLVAVHEACESLKKNECGIAIAGSSTISLPDKTGYLFQDGMVKSPDGHCRAFDINASGFVNGTGAGAVVLKKLSKAIEDRDNIYAVVKATAINNDGSNKLGYTAPSVKGQKNVIQNALKNAGVHAESIQYIEAHGTATPLGDSVEIEALKQAFNTTARNFCGIGSVKTNIGHLDSTAGVAGLIKTALALKHRIIPPTLNVTVANPKLNLIDSPFYLVTEPTEWKNDNMPLRAGISSLGLGGTNAHVIVEEPPVLEDVESARTFKLILLSARTESALNKQIEQLTAHLDKYPEVNMADLAYTLQTGRTHFACRTAFAVEDRTKAIEQLSTGLALTYCPENINTHIVFNFVSSGIKNIVKWIELYKTEAVFKKEIDECMTTLSPYIEPWFISTIDNQVTLRYEDVSAVEENPFIIFCIQYAMAKTLISWGIKPNSIKGDGMEEAIKIALSNAAPFEEVSNSIVSKLKNIEQNSESICCELEAEELSDTKICIYVDFGNNAHGATERKNIIQLIINPSEVSSLSGKLLEKLGQLWRLGVTVDWENFHSEEKRRRISLPTYPFDRQRYWIEGNPFKMTPMKISEGIVKKQNISDWFYVPLWEQSLMNVASDSDPQEHSGWMVFMDDMHFHTKLVNELEERVGTVIRVRKGKAFGKLGENDYHINYKEENNYTILLDALAAKGKLPRSIVSLWSVSDNNSYEELTIESVYKELDSGFFSITYLAKALANQSSTDKTKIIVVTSSLHNVDGSGKTSPAKAAVLGPCKVIPQELTFVRCSNIDISIPEARHLEDKLVQKLIREMTRTMEDTVVAYRNNIRYTQTYAPVVLPKNNTKFKEKGVYLITGGIGNIGFSISDYLANNYHAKLILIGRSSFPKRGEREKWLVGKGESDPLVSKVKRVIELEKQGAEIHTYSGDISDFTVIRSIVEDAEHLTGKINGVIHAAGAMRESLYKTLNEINREDCEKQFVPKIFGTMVLYRLFCDKELDFFTVTSSTSSVLGGLGFAAYSAANIFMDSFISEFNRASGKDWISVNWEGWKFSVEGNQLSFNFSVNELFMEPEEGVEVFKYVTNSHGLERVVVSSGSMDDRINCWIRLNTSKDSETDKKYYTKIDRSDLKTTYVSPENKMEEKIVAVFRDFFGYDEIGIHDNFFDLGASSLDMVQITDNLRKALNMNIPILKLFSFPTIHSFAQNLTMSNEEATTSSGNIDRADEIKRGKSSIQLRYNLRKK